VTSIIYTSVETVVLFLLSTFDLELSENAEQVPVLRDCVKTLQRKKIEGISLRSRSSV